MWGQTERIREALETFLCVHAARPKHNIWQKTKRSAWFGLRLKMFGRVLPMNQCNTSTMIKHWVYKTPKQLHKICALYAKSSQENLQSLFTHSQVVPSAFSFFCGTQKKIFQKRFQPFFVHTLKNKSSLLASMVTERTLNIHGTLPFHKRLFIVGYKRLFGLLKCSSN